MAGSEAITVEIDPHAELPQRYHGSDEDGAHYGPMSLMDATEQAARAECASRPGTTYAMREEMPDA